MCNPEPVGRIGIVPGLTKIRSNRLLKSLFAGMQTRGKSCGGVTKPVWGVGRGGGHGEALCMLQLIRHVTVFPLTAAV